MTQERKFSLVLWGATGFTGKLVAEYLTVYNRDNAQPLRWALAARNQRKLEDVRQHLTTLDPAASQVPLLLGDSKDLASLQEIAAQTDVICSTVGPFARYGSELVEACVQKGTHYCDITGETHWVRAMIDAHHEQAAARKLRIVHCCGYDSIPSDLGCWMVQEEMRAQHGVPCEEVKGFTGPTKGAASGGTIASMLNIFDEAKDRSVRRVLGDPYALYPAGVPRGPDRSDQRNVRWDADLGRWTGPFVMAAINTRIVRRSNALLDFRYGENFRYSEAMSFSKGARGWWRSRLFTFGLGGFFLLGALKPTRKLLQATLLPAPGEGPSKAAQEAGFFTFFHIGKAGDKRVYGRVRGEKDPGYGATAIMLGQAALCLALDQEQLPASFGVTTPAASMGGVLLERLRNAGIAFEVSATPFGK